VGGTQSRARQPRRDATDQRLPVLPRLPFRYPRRSRELCVPASYFASLPTARRQLGACSRRGAQLDDPVRDVIVLAGRSEDVRRSLKVMRVSKRSLARAALSHSAFLGISRHHLGQVVTGLGRPWQARRERDLRCGGAAAVSAAVPRAPGAVMSWYSPTGCWSRWRCCGCRSRTPRWRCARGGPVHGDPGGAPGPAAAGCRREAFHRVWGAAFRALRRVRLRRCPWSHAASGRQRDPGPPPPARRPGRRPFVAGKKKMNTIKFTRVCATAGTCTMGRSAPAASTTRPPADRRHRRPAGAVPTSDARDGRRLPGPASRPPRPGQRPPSRQAPQEHATRGDRPPRKRAHHAQSRPGSASSTPPPTAGTGGPCSAGSGNANSCPRPSRRSAPWYLTAPPPGNLPLPADHPGTQARTLRA
jgi:hypothetical protein